MLGAGDFGSPAPSVSCVLTMRVSVYLVASMLKQTSWQPASVLFAQLCLGRRLNFPQGRTITSKRKRIDLVPGMWYDENTG